MASTTAQPEGLAAWSWVAGYLKQRKLISAPLTSQQRAGGAAKARWLSVAGVFVAMFLAVDWKQSRGN
jgi:hypothetical protein